MALENIIGRQVTGGYVAPGGSFSDIDAVIRSRTPIALDILRKGAGDQQGLIRRGTEEALAPLREVDDLRAFEEQQALLGLRGEAAQEQAIGNIPVSEFDQMLRERQQKQLMRQAAAQGEAGGGATFEAGAQLAGAQQAQFIQNRLAQLSPLVAASRSIRSDISQVAEQGRLAQAQVQSGLGTQMGSIRLGAAAPQIQQIQNAAELSGLQKIATANRRADQMGQLAGLAGMFIGR